MSDGVRGSSLCRMRAGVCVPPVAFAVAFGAARVAEHLVEIAIVSAVSGVLAVAAVVAIMRWQERRQARLAVSRPIWTARVSGTRVPIPAASAEAEISTARGDSGRLALGPAEVHLHFHRMARAEQAEVIRQALPEHVRDARTEGR
jgi:hypothetical protein